MYYSKSILFDNYNEFEAKLKRTQPRHRVANSNIKYSIYSIILYLKILFVEQLCGTYKKPESLIEIVELEPDGKNSLWSNLSNFVVYIKTI